MKELEPLTREQIEARVEDLCYRVAHGPAWKDRSAPSLYCDEKEKKPLGPEAVERLVAWKLEAEKKHIQHAANLVGYAQGVEWPQE